MLNKLSYNSSIHLTNLFNTLKTMTSNLDNGYFITYSNYFKIDDKTFAFRKKVLFDISNLPLKLELKDNNNCLGYWINRK
jgi:hypothetical protein